MIVPRVLIIVSRVLFISMALFISPADAAESASTASSSSAFASTESADNVGHLSIERIVSRAELPQETSARASESDVYERDVYERDAHESDLDRAPHATAEFEIEQAIRAALALTVPDHDIPDRNFSDQSVTDHTAFSHNISALRVEITAHSGGLLPPGQAEFSLVGASKPSPLHPEAPVLWRGYWKTSDGRRMPIWARVRALCLRPVVRLRVDVPAGAPLASSWLEQVSVLDSALRTDPDESITDFEGKVLRHLAKAGSVISTREVTDPPIVRRNMVIPVVVISGSLHLRLNARAEADGRVGEPIRLVTPGGHRQFLAHIQPDGSAIMQVASESAGRSALVPGALSQRGPARRGHAAESMTPRDTTARRYDE